jgi:hypothetical protein
MALHSSPLAQIKAAAACTREERNASLLVEFTGFELPGQGETVMEVGRIDFSSGLTELGGGIACPTAPCFRRDLRYLGPPQFPVGPLTAGSPLWLIEVTQGAITACAEGSRWHRDVEVECYTTYIDLVTAAESSPYELASPGGLALTELRRIPGVIMLDDRGRLRVVEVELAGLRAKLTLEDFGQLEAQTPFRWVDQVATPPDF